MAKGIADYVKAQEGEALPLPKYRALMNLVYGDLVVDIGLPELVGTIHAWAGDTTELYYPLRKYADRIALLINMGAIELIQEVKSKSKGV